MRIDGIVLNNGNLHGFAFQIIPFDPDGKPILLRYGDPVSFEQLSFNVIHSQKREFYLIFIFLKFILLLLDLLKILKKELNEISHICLVEALPGRSLDPWVVDGVTKLQYRKETKRHDSYLFILVIVKKAQIEVRVGEIDPDFFLFLKIEFESKALILRSVFIEYLLYIAGIILHDFEYRFHFLDHSENPIFVRALR